MQSILIVDDVTANIKILIKLLERNYKTYCAQSGKAALELALSEKPDLIIIDIRMPEMDGYEVCQHLKEKDETKDIPVILILEGNEEADEIKGLELGAVDYINKPFRAGIVLARVRNQLRLSMTTKELKRHHNIALNTNVCLQDQIIERKRVEKEILQKEERLKRLVDILQHPSETMQEFLDYSLKQAIQMTESKIGYIYYYHEDRKEFVLNTWSKEVMEECTVVNPQTCYALDKTGIWGEAVRQRRPIVINDLEAAHPLKKGYPKGHVHLANFLTVPIFKNDHIVGVVGLANKGTDYGEADILQVSLLMEAVWTVTDRMKAEEALQQSNARYDELVRRIPVGIYTVRLNPDGGARLEYASEKFFRILGVGEQEVLRHVASVYRCILPEDRASLYEANRIAGQTLEPFRWEGRFLLQDEIHWLRIESESTLLPNGYSLWNGVIFDITDRKRLEEELQQLATTDQLTGIYNRRKIDQVFIDEKKRAERYEQALSVVMGDIDKFKLVNDLHGHQVGDMVLTTIAKIFGEGVRETDILGRWGGEEFMVVCPCTDLGGAVVLAEKLRKIIEANEFDMVGRKTCSFGVAQLAKNEPINAMVARADAALYRAKEKGRNRVEADDQIEDDAIAR